MRQIELRHAIQCDRARTTTMTTKRCDLGDVDERTADVHLTRQRDAISVDVGVL